MLIKAKSDAQIVRSLVVLETVGCCHFHHLKNVSNSHLDYMFRHWLVLSAEALVQRLQPDSISNSRLL